MPGVPKLHADDSAWTAYLNHRASLIETLTRDLRTQGLAADTLPVWATELTEEPVREVVADIEIWRVTHQIPDTDLRPTGSVRSHVQEARVQHRLDGRLAKESVTVPEWVDHIHDAFPDTVEGTAVLRTARAFASEDPVESGCPIGSSAMSAHPCPTSARQTPSAPALTAD